MKKFFATLILTSLVSVPFAEAAPQKYKVNMRVALKGISPISVATVAKSGKKAYYSEISEDGKSETLVEMVARRSEQDRKKGLMMDVTVTRRVRGHQKIMEKARFFAPENEEYEMGMNSTGKTKGNLALAVMAHQI